MADEQATRVVTGKARLSYFNGWKPTAAKGSTEEKYNTVVLIPKTDKATIKRLNDAVEAAIQLGIVKKWGGKKPPPAKLKLPIYDGDVEKPEDENYAGHMYFNASGKQKPGIIDKKGNPIIDEEQAYSGVFAQVSVNFYPYDTNSVGVGVGLNNIMILGGGDKLAGGASAQEDFADFIGEDAAQDEEDLV